MAHPQTEVADIQLQPTTHLSTPKGQSLHHLPSHCVCVFTCSICPWYSCKLSSLTYSKSNSVVFCNCDIHIVILPGIVNSRLIRQQS